MRIISAIVLLLWAVCYGRCLTEQYGTGDSVQQQWCEQECCRCDEPSAPAPEPSAPCEVCEFIKSGVVLAGGSPLLDAPVLDCLADEEPSWLMVLEAQHQENVRDVMVVDTGPPRAMRLHEWMARTAAPVRGPNAVA